LLDGAKLAGLLLEGLQAQGRFAVLIGFGVNIASAPAGTPYPAAALRRCDPADGAADLRDAVFAALSRRWLEVEALWRNGGFAPIRAAWLEVAHGLGQHVRVRPPSGEILGRMLGIDAQGRLLMATETGEQRIDAGDLFFGH
jgi:BirA family biotin operon repressor/biotin-[acetyl-CoA-carboxylase] ligase